MLLWTCYDAVLMVAVHLMDQLPLVISEGDQTLLQMCPRLQVGEATSPSQGGSFSVVLSGFFSISLKGLSREDSGVTKPNGK